MARRRLGMAVLVAGAILAGSVAISPVGAAQRCEGDLPPGSDAERLEAAIVCLVNEQRARASVAPVSTEARLATAARAHARDMVARRYFSHRNPEGESARERVRRAGYEPLVFGEALGWGSGGGATPRSTVKTWMDDPPHRKILLDPRYLHMGSGAADGGPTSGAPAGSLTHVAVLASPAGEEGTEPEAGRSVRIGLVRGVVYVTTPGQAPQARSATRRRLAGTEIVPVGSQIDARRGAVRLTSAADLGGATQQAVVSDGAFVVRQRRSSRPVTDLHLTGGSFRSCGSRASAHDAGQARRGKGRGRRVRRVWARGKGRFRTRSRGASAIVRGTTWLTQDHCNGTLYKVRKGSIVVRHRGRRAVVRRGQELFVRTR